MASYCCLVYFQDMLWQNQQKPYHVLVVLQAFIEHLAKNPNLIPASDRKRLVLACMDSVANYLVDLQATSSTDQQVLALIANFKATQAKLERMSY